jgi:hypothetical protein
MMRKKKEKMSIKKKCMRKEKNMSMCKNKIK